MQTGWPGYYEDQDVRGCNRMKKFWQTLSSYVWWTHARGSVHYDVMVTIILLFIFIAPFKIDFNDKPAERIPHPKGIVAYPDGKNGLVFEVAASEVAASAAGGKEPDAVKADLSRAIAPYAGNVELVRYEAVKDRGKVSLYRVWILRR
jgi:hypothetical protein